MPSERTASELSTQYAEDRKALLARPGTIGPGQRRSLSDLTDRWLADLLGEVEGVALVAVGGYGRRELSPGSDLDLVLVHEGRSDFATLAEQTWYPIWDAGVKLDHSVRTVSQMRRVAGEDLPAQLGLLDVRRVAGDGSVTEGLRSTLLADWRATALRRLPELRVVCEQRAERFGELAFLLEPDLKEARGGLRDAIVLRAISASWLADPPHGTVEGARERLLDARDALHMVTGRATDRLLLQEQDAAAELLGLLDADALLRVVSEAARTIAYAADVTWRRVGQVLEARRRRGLRRVTNRVGPPRAPLADGVVEQGGEVVLARDAEPARDPLLVLRTAAAAAQAGLPLSPHAVERLATESAPMPVPWPDPARNALVSLLGAGQAAVGVWEALDQRGLITRLLPDWERVRCRPQRNPIHRYTVDRHLVVAAANAAALTRRVSRPDLLLVGALLHDIGKGWPGDHTDAGVVIVRDIAPRLGFDVADTDTLVTLVRHHLLLVDTATRRDLDDPATVAAVAAATGSSDVLDLLHALTEADALATGPAVWNSWRAGLVDDLVARTDAVLQGRAESAPPSLSPAQRQLANSGQLEVSLDVGTHTATLTVVTPDRVGLLALVAGVLALHRLTVRAATTDTVQTADGVVAAVQVWTVAPEYGSLPDMSVLRDDLRRALAGTLNVAKRLAQREAAYPARPGIPVPPPRVDVVPEASETATVIEVRAHDRPALLHRIGAALADEGLDVLSARVNTLGAEAVDAFYVVDARGEPLSSARAAEVAKSVRKALRQA
jgi:[protein-PII] uridylyltransferase